MKICVRVVAASLLLAIVTACGGSPRPATSTPSTPLTPPTPPQSSAQPGGDHAIAFLRALAPPASGGAVAPMHQVIAAHGRYRQAPVSDAQEATSIYVLPFSYGNGWWYRDEVKVTPSPNLYTSVHAAMDGGSLVFSALVNGYNQIFFSKMPAAGETIHPVQLTTDPEHHWLPHLSQNGAQVAFTKYDPASNGDVLCVLGNTGGDPEKCLDFSATTPVLRGANLWHASWFPDDRIIFEAWGGPLGGDELFSVDADGAGLTQMTRNAGASLHYESPSVSSGGEILVVAGCSGRADGCRVRVIDLAGKTSYDLEEGWDPLYGYYTVLWVTGPSGAEQLGIDLAFSTALLTKSGYGNFFEAGLR